MVTFFYTEGFVEKEHERRPPMRRQECATREGGREERHRGVMMT